MLIRLKSVQFDPLEAKQAAAPPGWDRWIVQASRPLTRDDLARLQREYGLALQRYVPDGAYVERANADLVARLRAEPLIRWIGPYLPAYKLDPAIAKRQHADPARNVLVLVEGFGDVAASDLRSAIERAGFARVDSIETVAGSAPRARVTLPPSADVDVLTRLAEVSFIELESRIDIDRLE